MGDRLQYYTVPQPTCSKAGESALASGESLLVYTDRRKDGLTD